MWVWCSNNIIADTPTSTFKTSIVLGRFWVLNSAINSKNPHRAVRCWARMMCGCFAKVFLNAGESREVSIEVKVSDLARWNTPQQSTDLHGKAVMGTLNFLSTAGVITSLSQQPSENLYHGVILGLKIDPSMIARRPASATTLRNSSCSDSVNAARDLHNEDWLRALR